ncbi:MAG: hypothetical protein KAW14_10455 [Candidatus Aegiribacteria sp.]|nr:hypothetical protein [Candidatus Aegiribacteria sp.]
MWLKVIVFAIIVLVFIITIAILYGSNRWQSNMRELHARMEAARLPIVPETFHSHEWDGLPAPVQRYFHTVLKEGQLLIAAVSLEHTGTFNMSETGEQWKPFKSTQRVITRRPSFVWDAHIRMAPAISVFVLDAYIAGEGLLTAKLFGFLTVMEQPDTPELAQGELMRFFAEGTWYPTALLPGQGVVWEAIDDTHASATLTDGSTTVRLVFQFDVRGLISSVRSDERYREVDGMQVSTPWRGRFWNYELHDGMLIPLEAEVEWLLPEGPKPYWRGRIQQIEYEYAQ